MAARPNDTRSVSCCPHPPRCRRRRSGAERVRVIAEASQPRRQRHERQATHRRRRRNRGAGRGGRAPDVRSGPCRSRSGRPSRRWGDGRDHRRLPADAGAGIFPGSRATPRQVAREPGVPRQRTPPSRFAAAGAATAGSPASTAATVRRPGRRRRMPSPRSGPSCPGGPRRQQDSGSRRRRAPATRTSATIRASLTRTPASARRNASSREAGPRCRIVSCSRSGPAISSGAGSCRSVR